MQIFMRPFWSTTAQFNKATVALILLLLLTFSCKKRDSDLGLNLRSDNGLIDAFVVDTLDVIAYTVQEDSLRTDSLNSNIIGAINDPVFGTSAASVGVNFKLDAIGFDFGTSPQFDSIVLSLVYYDTEKFYGDTNSSVKLNIYKLNEKLVSDDKYYSNYQFTTSDLIDTWEGEFAPQDSVSYVEKGVEVNGLPQLRIKLPSNFGQSFIDNAPGIFASQETFDDFLNGIAIVPDVSGLGVGQGAIAPIYLKSIHSNLTLYYNDTLFKEFNINTSSERVNTYELNNWSADIMQQLSNPNVNSERVYLQAMGGLKAKIELPDIFDLVKDGRRILINEAKIVFQIEPGSESGGLSAPDRLLMVQPSEVDGTNSLIIDLIDEIAPPSSAWQDHTNYGGTREGDEYTFHFNRHLQQLLDDYLIKYEDNNRGFYLIVPSDKPITPARMILDNSGTGSDKKIKLKITYTKL
jgi:hypothetical protein